MFAHFTSLFSVMSAFKNGVCDIFPRHRLLEVNRLVYQELSRFLFQSVKNKNPIFILHSSKKCPSDKNLLPPPPGLFEI